jgi:tetratricopeptide (TPR) repeat protein
MVYTNLAEVEIHLGLFVEADRNLKDAAVSLAVTPNEATEATMFWYLGELRAIQGASSEAEAHFFRALKCTRIAGLIEREAETLARLGRLQKDPSMTQKALEVLDTPAIRASVLAVAGDHQSAIQLLREHKNVYEEMRLAADLTIMTNDSAWLLETQRLLEKLRHSNSDSYIPHGNVII